MRKNNIIALSAIALIGVLAFFLLRKGASQQKDLETTRKELDEQLLMLDAKRKMPNLTSKEIAAINKEIEKIQSYMSSLGLQDVLKRKEILAKLAEGITRFPSTGV